LTEDDGRSFHVYVLLSERDGRLYTGVTANLERRLKDHELGRVKSTKPRRPLRLIYTERFETKRAAYAREAYFKTAEGGALKQTLVASARRPK
jgi:putative endonuclease